MVKDLRTNSMVWYPKSPFTDAEILKAIPDRILVPADFQLLRYADLHRLYLDQGVKYADLAAVSNALSSSWAADRGECCDWLMQNNTEL